MLEQQIGLAYSQDNSAKAQTIIEDLKGTINFKDFIVGGEDASTPLVEQLASFQGPVLLLVSDNFLRSTSAMQNGLRLLNSLGDRLLPIIVDGVKKDADTGQLSEIETKFDRVSDIIQYVNFWQDRYLDLRRQRREAQGPDEAAFEEYLRLVRDISSEVGEFLRMLRNTWHLKQYELSINHYEQLFIFLDEPEAWEAYRASAEVADMVEAKTTAATVEEVEQPAKVEEIEALEETTDQASEIITEETEEQIEEVKEEIVIEEITEAPVVSLEESDEFEEEEDEEEEAPDVDLSDIPGISQLGIDLSKTHEGTTAERNGHDKPIEHLSENVSEDVAISSEKEMDMAEQTAILIEKAWSLVDKDEASTGLELIEAGLDKYAGRTDLRYHYALMLAQTKEAYQEAEEQLDMILQLEPDNLDALFLLAELATSNNEVAKARRLYERVQSIEPNYPELNHRLGELLINHYPDEKLEASELIALALKQDEDNADLQYQYALLSHQPLGRINQAIQHLHKTLEIAADHPFAHYDLALLYHQLGEKEAAQKAYQLAIKNNPALQTPENDRAFTPVSNNFAFADQGREQETLSALRDNINQLENMLRAREEEAEKRRQMRPGKDKTVLITGATAGIGKATAIRFAQDGYRLILTGRREERLADLQEQLSKEYEVEVLPISFDVRKPKSAQKSIKDLKGDWKNIDILINNAGKAKGFDFIHEGDLDHWEEMIDTNIKGLLYMTRAVSPGMVERGKGHIINVCSTAGHEVYPKGAVYCATKFAVDALTKGTRLDLHRYGIRVSQVSPAHVEETEFAMVRFDGDAEKANIYEGFKPLTSRDVADAIHFMATRPNHVNVQDVLMMGTQQASSMVIDRSGRAKYEEEEE